jgi:hypothetical protein
LAAAQFEAMVSSYASARRRAIAAVGQPVGMPFDAELSACKTAGDVRAVFGRNWPTKAARATPAYKSDTLRLAEALEHAARVLESQASQV